MKTNKILIAGLVGGVVSFIMGFLIYGMLLNSFMASHTVPGVSKSPEEGVMWAIIVASFFLGFLFAIIYGRWAGIKTLKTGAIAGAVIGLLMVGHVDFIMYGTANIYTDLTVVIVDMLAFAVYSGVVGGVVGLMLGMGKDA